PASVILSRAPTGAGWSGNRPNSCSTGTPAGASFFKYGLGSIEQAKQPLLHARPFRRHNGEPRRITRNEIHRHAVRAKNPFELSSNTFQSGPRPRIPRIGMEADAVHLPRFKSVGQHEQFAFRVGRRADGGARQPRVADLTGIGCTTAVERIALWPRPALDVEEPG